MQSGGTTKKPSRLMRLTWQKVEVHRQAAAQEKEAELATPVKNSPEEAQGVSVGHDNEDLFVPQDNVNVARESSTVSKSNHDKDASSSAATGPSDPAHNRSDMPSHLPHLPHHASNDSDTGVCDLQAGEPRKMSDTHLRVGLTDTTRYDISNFVSTSNGGLYRGHTATSSGATNLAPIAGTGNAYYGVEPENSRASQNEGDPRLLTVTDFGTNPNPQKGNTKSGQAQVTMAERPNNMENTAGSEPQCLCSISTNCPLAAQKGIKDCRTSLAPVYARNKVKVQKNPSSPRKAVTAKERARITRSNHEVLETLALFKKSRTASGKDLERIYDNLRLQLRKVPFHEIGPDSQHLVPKFLDPQTGLAAIVNTASVPWDIKLDSETLRARWERGDTDTDLLRGICVRISDKTENSDLTSSALGGISRSLDTDYRFRQSSDFIGEGHLKNGQWFPLQIAAVRDGAHGETEAGISGYKGVAVSIVLNSSASKKSYADIDEGTTISYCGTRGKDNNTSAGTQLLLESEKRNTPVRLLRGAKLNKINPYRPEVGLRYDGLYKIVGNELLEENSQLFRFRLQRIEGQTPIRNKGKEARPTPQEVEEWKSVQNHLAGTRRGFDKKRKRE